MATYPDLTMAPNIPQDLIRVSSGWSGHDNTNYVVTPGSSTLFGLLASFTLPVAGRIALIAKGMIEFSSGYHQTATMQIQVDGANITLGGDELLEWPGSSVSGTPVKQAATLMGYADLTAGVHSAGILVTCGTSSSASIGSWNRSIDARFVNPGT